MAAALAATREALAGGIGEHVTRVAALPGGGQCVAAAIGGTLGPAVPPDARLPLGPAAPVTGGGPALVAAAPLGRLTGDQIQLIAGLVAAGEFVRMGIAGRLVIPLAGPARHAREVLAAAGLIVASDHPMADVTACSGAACVRSLADVRAAAGPVPDHARPHWVGCSRGCGRPPDAEPVVALSATRYRMPGEAVA
jgi:precorrin-3B synthase